MMTCNTCSKQSVCRKAQNIENYKLEGCYHHSENRASVLNDLGEDILKAVNDHEVNNTSSKELREQIRKIIEYYSEVLK